MRLWALDKKDKCDIEATPTPRRGKTVPQDDGRFRRVSGLAVEEPTGLENRRLVLTYARNR